MSQIISHNIFDCTSTIIVPVIASFDSEGRIKPLYVRIYGASYKIDSSVMHTNFINTIDFNCKVIDGDSIKPLLLTFHRKEGVWSTQM